MNRKNLLFLSVVLVALLSISVTLAQDKTVLVINSFGGAYEEAHRALVIEEFEEMHNVEIEVVTAYSADMMAQLQAQADNPQFDVVHFSGGQEIIAAEMGLLEPIMPEELTNYDDMYEFAVANIKLGQGPVYSIAAVGLIYNTEALEEPPTSWADVLNPEYAGHVVLTDISNTYGLLGMLAINSAVGGDLDDIQPGLDAIAGILDDATIVTSSQEIQQAFAQEDAWIAIYAQDYAYTLTEAGLPVAFVQPEEGSPAVFITTSVVSGRPNTDLAKAFVDFSIRAEAQAGWAEALHYSPTNAAVELDEELATQVIYGEEAIDNIISLDWVKINEMRSDWTDMWNRMIAK